MKHRFELINGRINLITTIQVWDEVVENSYDVTDEITPVYQQYVDLQLAQFFANIKMDIDK